MRGNLSPAEQQLWLYLRSSLLGGYKFRRQTVIEPYICDFFCPAKGLIVELDGDTHDVDADRRRDQELAKRGFRVVRFTNSEVMGNVDGVLQVILSTLNALPNRFAHPPTPSLQREGEL